MTFVGFVPQLHSALWQTRAAERAVSRQNGGGQPYHLGETAHEDQNQISFVPRRRSSFCHPAGLEASPSSLAQTVQGVALDRATFDLDPARLLVLLWRLRRRTLCHRPRLLRGLPAKETPARRNLARFSNGL